MAGIKVRTGISPQKKNDNPDLLSEIKFYP